MIEKVLPPLFKITQGLKKAPSAFIRCFFSIYAVILFSLLLRIKIYHPYPPTWDAAVYIMMGKYLFSSGTVGFIEPFRPLIWPGILGLFWKMGGDPIFWGRFLSVVLTMGNIFLIYRIGKHVTSEKTSVLAAWLLSLSPTFFYWGPSAFADIPGSFLGLLSVYFYVEKRYVLSGVSVGLAFHTKFVQILTILALFVTQGIRSLRENRILAFVRIGIGLILPMALVFFINAHLYNHMFTPFRHAQVQYTKVPYIWWVGIPLVIQKIVSIEGIFMLFVPFSLLLKKQKWSYPVALVFFLPVLLVLWIGKLPSEIMRFSIPSLPYLYLLSAIGISQIYRKLQGNHKKLASLFVLFLCVMMGYQLHRTATIRLPRNRINGFQQYALNNQEVLKGKNIWVSNPKTLAYSDLKATQLMYYSEIGALLPLLTNADIIFFDSRDLPCVSVNSTGCSRNKRILVQRLLNEFDREAYESSLDGKIIVGIFKKKVGRF